MFGNAAKKRIPAEDEEIDITPMIDVTFLLLIFFMVTSNMQDTASLQIPPAKHGMGVSTDQSVVLSIFKTDGDPEVYLSDGKRENGPASLSDVTNYVNEGVQANRLNVIIKADRDVPSGFVEDVARAANEVDAELKFYVGVMDKPK